MLTHTVVRRAGFLVVLITGIGCAGHGFGADGEGREKSKKAGAGIPRELAMRPLPTYRIEPPDIIQIEVTCAKAAQDGENQPAKKPDEVKPSGGAGTEPGSSSLNVTGSAPPVENKSGAGRITATFVGTGVPGENKAENGQVTGKIYLSGAPGENKVTITGVPAEGSTGSTTVTAGTLTFNSTEPAGGEALNKVGSGTLTLSRDNTYTGTTTVATVTDRGEMQVRGWQPGMQTLVLGNATPSPDSIKITRTSRGISGADLGTGQYLVAPDGNINMRQYGMVQVMGMTVVELKDVLEKHLSKYIESPEVWINVLGYNSKVFYIITDGAGSGDNVRRMPITGNETVLDAMAAVGGLSPLSSKRIWLSRPSSTNSKKGTILPIDYVAITQQGATETNYQIMPGDRIFIAGDRTIALNNNLGKITAPVERMLGVISLGTSTIRSIKHLINDDKDRQESPPGDW
jgi:autotransporter-associated beta strand protein